MILQFRCQAILFDLDGTLIDSRASVSRAWVRWCLINGLEPGQIVPKIQGRRSIDSIRLFAPQMNASDQDQLLRKLERDDTRGVTPIKGAEQFLDSLPPECWSIVTSGASDVAQARILAGGLRIPERAVYGEDVQRGKPDPEPFLVGAARHGVEPSRCLVFEDTVSGIRAAQAAGMATISVGREGAEVAEAWISDLTQMKAEITTSEMILTISEHSASST